jgi:predicted kinase
VGAVDSPTDLQLRDGAKVRDGADVREGADRQDGAGARRLEQRLERLAAGHPSSPDYADRRGPADRVRPLTDAEHTEHVAEVRGRLEAASAGGIASDVLHTVDPRQEVWSRDRRATHDAIVEELYAAASEVPCEGRAIIAGGLPGAGKTTVLERYASIEPSQYLTINPDVIKLVLARRDLLPRIEGLSPMEASVLAHEETSHIAKRLAHRAQSDGRNIIWDVTMSSSASSEKRISSLRESGYTRIDGLFVDIPVDVSLRRVDARHRAAHDEYRDGRGPGGRFVPRETILQYADQEWGSENRKNFERLKASFDSWSRYDNSVDGRDPQLVESHSSDDDLHRSI